MIPDINNPKWKELVTGKLKPEVSSFSLQMKLNSLMNIYSNKLISQDTAVKELHELCQKYEKIYKADLDKIFNQ